ncbi:MAG: sialate O-acetylesterase, partial [Eubacteriales bacterium]
KDFRYRNIFAFILFFTVLALTVFGFAVAARTAYVAFENFEDGEHTFVQTSQNGSKAVCEIVDDGTGNKALLVTQNNSYAHVGMPIKLKKDVAYSFSYDVKSVSYADGTAYAESSMTISNANFLFTDANCTNKKMNHVTGYSKFAPSSGWQTVAGTYTPKSSVVAEDADLDNVWFCIYLNPTDGKNNKYMIDNIKVTYEDDEPLDGENYFQNGSFENLESIEMEPCNGTVATLGPGDLDAADGVYSLRVTSFSNYGHIGIPVKLEEGRTYEYSYSIKMISNNKGEPVQTPVPVFTNFVFSDANASNKQLNHNLFGASIGSETGWQRISGTYTPSYDTIAADSDLENAWFSVYCHPSGGAGTVWLIDNVVLKRKPLQALEQQVVLPDLISDNILVQMGEPIPVWGAYAGGETLTIALADGERIISEQSVTPADGKFSANLPAVNEYYTDLTLTFTVDGTAVTVVENVAVGELWHFSGQSNMAMQVYGCGTHRNEILPDKDMPSIRYFAVGTDGQGKWKTATRANVNGMSAVAYKTMETIYNGLDGAAPVGGLNTAVGGKPMASYTGPCDFSATGGSLYRSLILPITALPIRGHIWYQGESDTKTANFTAQFQALIETWRDAWNDPDDSFIFVQLPQSTATIPDWWGGLDSNGLPTRTSTYDYTNVRFWQNALYESMKDQNVGMVVTFDTTTKIEEQKSLENMNAEDPLHPWNKAPIGIRLGNYALHEVYGKTEIRHLSPYPNDIRAFGKYIAVKFDGVYDGLSTTDGLVPRFFEIVDAAGVYHTPDVVTVAAPDTLVLYCRDVTDPSGVAYAYENHFVDMSKAFT